MPIKQQKQNFFAHLNLNFIKDFLKAAVLLLAVFIWLNIFSPPLTLFARAQEVGSSHINVPLDNQIDNQNNLNAQNSSSSANTLLPDQSSTTPNSLSDQENHATTSTTTQISLPNQTQENQNQNTNNQTLNDTNLNNEDQIPEDQKNQTNFLFKTSLLNNQNTWSIAPVQITATQTAQTIYDIKIDPKDSQVIYVAAGRDGLLKSTDGGNSWSQILYSESLGFFINKIEIQTNTGKIFAFGMSPILYSSQDSGLTWQSLNVSKFAKNPEFFMGINNLILDNTDPNILYLCAFEFDSIGFYKSLDKGATWSSLSEKIVSSMDPIFSFIIDPFNHNTLYIFVGVSGSFKSLDQGESWQKIRNLDNINMITSISPDQTKSGNFYFSKYGRDENDRGYCGLYLTQDNFNSFSEITDVYLYSGKKNFCPSQILTNAFDGNNIYLLENGTIWESLNQGQTWRNLSWTLSSSNKIFFNGNFLYSALGGDQGIAKYQSYSYDNAIKILVNFNEQPWQGDIKFKITGPNNTYFGSNTAEEFTNLVPGNYTFEFIGNGPLAELNLENNAPTEILPEGGLQINATDSKEFTLNFFAANVWQKINNELPEKFYSIAIDEQNPNVFFAAAGSKGIYKSINEGKTWQALLEFFLINENGQKFSPEIFKVKIVKDHVTEKQTLYAWGLDSRAIFKSEDLGENWENIPIQSKKFVNFNISNLTFDPYDSQTIFASTNQYVIFKSTDGGKNWQDLFIADGLYGDYLFIADTKNPNVFYILIKSVNFLGSFYVTYDGGENWKLLNNYKPVEILNAFVDEHNKNSFYFKGYQENYTNWQLTSKTCGLYKTTTAFTSFIKLPTKTLENLDLDLCPADLAVDSLHLGVLYASSNSGIFKSLDSGLTWQQIENQNIFASSTLFFSPSSKSELYALSQDGKSLEKYFPSDHKNTIKITANFNQVPWHGQLQAELKNQNGLSVKISQVPVDLSNLPVGKYSLDFLSGGPMQDYSKTTTTLSSITEEQTLDEEGNLTFTLDYNTGYPWEMLSAGFSTRFSMDVKVDPSDNQILYASNYYMGVSKSINGGNFWFPSSKGISNTDCRGVFKIELDPNNSGTLYALCQAINYFTAYKTFDSGQHWQRILYEPFLHAEGQNFQINFSTFIVDAENSQVLYAGLDSILKKSVDGGQNWTDISGNIPNKIKINKFFFDPFNQSKFYIASDKNLYLSQDQGQSFNVVLGVDLSAFKFIAADDTKKGSFYFGAFKEGGCQLYYTADSFLSINKILSQDTAGQTLNLCIKALAVDPRNSSNLYIATDSGVYFSYNGGKVWQNISNGYFHSATELSVAKNLHLLYAATGSDEKGIGKYEMIEKIDSGGQVLGASTSVGGGTAYGSLYVAATLAGKNYVDSNLVKPLSYILIDRFNSTTTFSAVPKTINNLEYGPYTIKYLSGGPLGAVPDLNSAEQIIWIYPNSTTKINFNFIRLLPGTSSLQVLATLDGREWRPQGEDLLNFKFYLTSSTTELSQIYSGASLIANLTPGIYNIKIIENSLKNISLSSISVENINTNKVELKAGQFQTVALNFISFVKIGQAIKISATLDGKIWKGDLKFKIEGPPAINTIEYGVVPTPLDTPFINPLVGKYKITFLDGGPQNSILDFITPGREQYVEANRILTFTFNFTSAPKGSIIIKGTLDGVPWPQGDRESADYNFEIRGVLGTRLFLQNSLPIIIPQYNSLSNSFGVTWLSGGPMGSALDSITPSNSDINKHNTSGDVKFNTKKQPLIFTLNFKTVTPVLFIPGVYGTELNDKDGVVWLKPLTSAITTDNYLKKLAYNKDLKPVDSEIVPGKVMWDPNLINLFELNYFKDFSLYFQSQGYSEGTSLFTFPYDWRDGASGDDSKVNNVSKLQQNINEIIASTSPTSNINNLNIIAHSTGGLLLKSYLAKILNDPSIKNKQQASHIDKAIYLGVPHTGAPKATYIMATGDTGVKAVNFNAMKEIAKNLPIVTDLAPSQNYLDFNFFKQIKCGSYQIGGGCDLTSLTNLDYFSTRERMSTTSSENVYEVIGINPKSFELSENRHNNIDNLDIKPAVNTLYAVNGCHIDTPASILEKQYTNEYGAKRSDWSIDSYSDGDGTVPKISYETGIVDPKNEYYAKDVEHSDLVSNKNTKVLLFNLTTNHNNSWPDKDVITRNNSNCK